MTAHSRITLMLVLVGVFAASEQLVWPAALLLAGFMGAALALLGMDDGDQPTVYAAREKDRS